MKDENTNAITSTEDGPFQQFEISLDQVSSLDARLEGGREVAPKHPASPARAQEHLRRLGVAGLSEADSRRTAKTEYVMRLLVSGRAPLEEPPVPAAPEPEPSAIPEPPEPERRPAVLELEPPQKPGRPAVQVPPRKVMTLENLTFDDLLAELENL